MKKQLIRFLSILFPGAITQLAYKTLTNPQIKKLRDREIAYLSKAITSTLPFEGFEIKQYEWGQDNGEKILLIHGWEGQAGNFTDIVERLLEHNYNVIAFDAPSHGFSSKGKTSLFEFSALVEKMIRDHGVKKLISHSFGGVATTWALQRAQFEIDKYLLLTTPDKFKQRINTVAEMVGITEKVKNRLIERLESELNIDVNTANVSEFVKDIKVKEALIIHDKNDKVIPISQSLNVHNNWSVCEFETIEGTGHFRILRTDFVIDKIMDFIK